MAEVDKVYDANVLGEGIEGSATAYEIASRERQVLLVKRVGQLLASQTWAIVHSVGGD